MLRGHYFYLVDIDLKGKCKKESTLDKIILMVRDYGKIKDLPDTEIEQYVSYLQNVTDTNKNKTAISEKPYRYAFGKSTRTRRFQYNTMPSQNTNINSLSDLVEVIRTGKYIIEDENGVEFDLLAFRCFDYEYIHGHPIYDDLELTSIEKSESLPLDTPVNKVIANRRIVGHLLRAGYKCLGDIAQTSFIEFWENTDLPEPNYEEIKKVLYIYGLLR